MLSARALQLTVILLAAVAPVTGAAVAPSDSAAAITPHDKVEDPDGNITILRGPGSLYKSIDAPSDLTAARDDGRLRTPESLAPGDLLSLQFDSERVADTYTATNGTNPTDRFFRMLESSATNFSIIGLNHGTGQLPSKFALNRSNVKVLYNASSDTFSLLVDTTNVSVVNRESGDQIRQTLEHREFQAILEISTENSTRVLAGSSQFTGIGARLESPMEGVQIAGLLTPTVTTSEAQNLTLTGTTPFLPSTNITIRAEAADSPSMVTRTVQTQNANASTDGFRPSAFQTTLPLRDVNRNSTVDITVVTEGTVLAEQTLLVGKPAKMYNTSARLVTSGPHEGEVAVTATMRLPEPGLLLVYIDGEPQTVSVPEHEAVERTLYVSQEAVDDHHNVYVLTMWDRNENGVYDPDIDTMFRTTADVGASAQDIELDTQIRVDGWPPKTTRRTTEQPATTTSGTSSTPTGGTPTAPTTSEPSSTTIPGFGFGVGLAGIVAAALLAMRN